MLNESNSGDISAWLCWQIDGSNQGSTGVIANLNQTIHSSYLSIYTLKHVVIVLHTTHISLQSS